MHFKSLGVHLLFLLFTASFADFVKSTFACDASSDHYSEVVKALNVTVRSEGALDSGKTPSTNGLAYIEVNGKNYATQTKGFNVAAFDALSGRFLTSAAYDCAASQSECNSLGTFITGLPQDTLVFLAVQESASSSGKTFPSSVDQGLGAKSFGSVAENTAYALIGYKGSKSVDWKNDEFKGASSGPAEISAVIPIDCSYVPQVSTTCSLFNVASQKYGGSCTSQSSSLSSATNCQYAVDGNFSSGWESSSSGAVNSYIQIGFHTIFTLNKLRIQQNAAKGQLIQELFIEFSDCSNEKITLTANNTEFQEFTFLSRRANWVKLTVQKVYGSSGGVGIQEIEFYNELCTQKTICDAVHLGNGSVSSRYRLLRTKFPFMVDAEEQVSVLLTSESRSASSRYEVVLASKTNTYSILKRVKDGQSQEVMKVNTSSLVKENEMRSFWIEVEKGRVVFGSGEKVHLFWRDAEPIKVKYAFLSATDSAAIFHICGRVDQCYKDAAHFWPLDKSTVFVRDLNKDRISNGKIHGTWTLRTAAAKLGFTPLALGLTGSSSWIDLGDFRDSCVTSLSRCPGGFSATFKANVAQSGTGTGYFLSASTFNVYYVKETVHFVLQDKERVWEVKGSYVKTTWQTFAMSWSRANGLIAAIIGDASSGVLRDPVGRTVTPSVVTHTLMTIGRPCNEKSNYADAEIRDVALWEEEITEDRIAKLHVCDNPDTCAAGWEYFDGSCYKVTFNNLSSSAAREACLNETADLVKITSEEENSFVNSLAQGEAWIGLEKKQDGVFYWKDGVRNSFNGKWKTGSAGSDPCVVMESDGDWRNILCSSTAPKYVCEQVRHHYLGCYEDSTSSPAFVFNPGGYKPSSMTPGLCMHACGYWYFIFAALKRGDLCLCSNSSSPANERASDMCSAHCLGSGDQKCGGDVHYISVYKSVEVRPFQLNMSSDVSVVTLSTFNITLTPTLPVDHAVEYYTINVGDGSIYHTTQQFPSIAILEPGTYHIQGRAMVKHCKTGYRSVIESSVTVSAVSSLTDVEVFCPSCAPINSTVSCSVKFRYGSEANVLVQFESGKDPVYGSLPDAAVMTWGIAVGEAGSPVTSDGLYLMAAMDAAGKGEVVAFDMDLALGGGLEIQVFRPKCVDSGQRYCPAQKMCISNFTLCSHNTAKSCGSEKAFSLAGGPCSAQNMSCCQNKTLGYGNFDYKRFSGFVVYTTNGLKRILIENKTERIQVEAGDVFGVRFPVSGPAAALKTSSASSSLFYSSSVLNKTNSSILLGNRLPLTEDNPRQTLFAPAIALIYATDSESKLENVYEDVGQKKVFISIANSKSRVNYTKSICLQETIRGLQLDLPEALPFAETVNLTVSITQGSNVTYSWDFGDKSNATSVTPWLTYVYNSVGEKSVSVLAGNNVGLMTLWCTVVIQERISGLQFKNDSLLAIENGTTARIGWMLFNGSHVDFNITITYPDGNVEATNLTNAKAPAARFFAMYKKNLTVPGWHRVQITATNKVNNETITGNLSVQLAVNGVAMNYPKILRTNQTLNFTILAHQGEARARYSLKTMDGKIFNTTDKVIPYAYTKAGRYKATLIAANDISAVVVNCAEIVVQDMIEGLQYTSFNHTVAVQAELEIFWRLTRGSELYLIINYGDGFSKIVNRSISVSSVFVAVSKHNYTKPGDYLVIINATNLVDSQTINTTVHVETPGQGSGLAVGRGNLTKAVSGPCPGAPLYVAVNDSVTATATIVNGTNLNVALDFGDGSSNRRLYFHRQFPDEGWTAHHSYSLPGEYNITVTFFNRNPQNPSDKCRVIVQYRVTVVEVTSDSPKRSSNSTITLTVSFPVPEPSGPLNYQWLHGDNTTQLLRDTRKTNHSYPNQCGVYVATVNVSNEVSYGFGMTEIIIQDAIQGLNISKHYTEFNTNDKYNCSGFRPEKDYFPFEFEVVFNSSITRGTNATFLWRFLRDDIDRPGKMCRHKFKKEGKNEVLITVNNSVSNQTKMFNITLVASILNVTLRNDGPTEQEKLVNFTLAMDQAGSGSCFEVDLNDFNSTSNQVRFKSDTPLPPCHLAKKEVQRSQRFPHKYKTEGEYNVILTAKNNVSCVAITSKVPVAKGFCTFPIITAPGFKEGETTAFKRSEKITIKTVNKINCYKPSTEFRWEIYKLCDNNEPRKIPVEDKHINTTRSELTLPPLFFDYCKKLEVRFMINMTKAKGVYSEKKIYLEITKSPLVAIIDGGSERTVGNEEPVEVDAGKSHDPDFDTTKKNSTVDNELNYAWFCMRDSDKSYSLPTNLSNLPPIPTPPPPPNKADNSSDNKEAENLGGCFGWGPGRLNFTSKKIVLNMTANSTYVIRFVLAKKDRLPVFADQRITVSPGDPPTVGIECVHNCASKLNPATKLTLRGRGKSKGNKKIFYNWKIEDCKNCDDRKEKRIQDYSSTALDSDNLVIKAGFFTGGATYKIILYGNVEGGIRGSSTYEVKVNEPPSGGKCTAVPPNGRPLERTFKVSCEGFEDKDLPLQYQFFYTADKGKRNESLGSGLDRSRLNVSLPNGKEENNYKIEFYVTVSDKLGASKTFEAGNVKVEKKKIELDKLVHLAENDLDKLVATGNVKETANMVSTLALVLNDQTEEQKSDVKAIQKVREKLVNAMLNNQDVSVQTNPEDLLQICTTVGAATAVPGENTPDMMKKVSSFIEDAGKALFQQATGKDASSEKIKEASEAVFDTAINVILTTDSSNQDDQSSSQEQSSTNASKTVTEKTLKTIDLLADALVASKIAGEEETKLEREKSLAIGVSRENVDNLGVQKNFSLGESEVVIPANFSPFGSVNSSVDRMSLVSVTNLYSGSAGAKSVNSKLVRLSFSVENGGNSKKEFTVRNLTEEEAISIIIPRRENVKLPDDREPVKLNSNKANLHTFNETSNESAVNIRVEWHVDVEMELYVKKGSEPKPNEGDYDFNVTLKRGEHSNANSSKTSDSTASELFLSNDALNWTAEGTYFVSLRFKDNGSLPAEEKAKMTSDGAVLYNFSVYSSMCRYYDERKNAWSTEGTKVGRKTCLEFTECLTTHLTTFGSNFFVPPNKINFKELSVKKLLESPHALITVCLILGLYLICLIPARRADRNDALKTGVTPLPDNDSRDTYCYEIHVHTGFARGAGTSAEVSIVLTGGLGDSQPRVLKDPNRKNFKTGSVDPFLLTVPQSLGNLKHIRIWHNNGGNYPSWNLLRVMIQDIQTDQRWWFVSDDWLAVDESDGKIERTLYPASKKELTKFNVLFTSEVRKNLTDGHIWFSVVTRPPRSTFTRVQRLTCCLSILMTTMVANAMFYQVGKNETPKNAIRIMGFSFSIQQVSIGIISSLVVFPANLIIVTIFRKVKPKQNRYTVKTENVSTDNIDIEAGEEKEKREKPPAKFALPHWFVYVAYGVAFVATCTSATFVIFYGMEFGAEKSGQWLSSMTISFLQDVLLMQPIKVFALATLFAVLIKDPKKAEQDSFTDANALANDEEWLHKNAEDLDAETQQDLKQLINDKPPDEAKLEIARKLRMKEKQMKSIIREIVWYVIFLLVLLTISYGNRDLTTSKVTGYMQNIFEKAAYSGNVTYKKVHEINHYWQWLNDTFIPSLLPQLYYDDSTSYERGYIADIPTAWLLGKARLRQLRIRKDTCTFKRLFLHFIHECNDFYSISKEDQGSYLPGWKERPLMPYGNISVNHTTTTTKSPLEEPSEKGPWHYQTGDELKTYPYWGYKATYSAGGYVQVLPKRENDSKEVVENLNANNWLDRYTRAVFSEFAIYNANVNLFCVVTLLFEQLPTGSLTPYPSILTLRLFRYVGGEMYFVLTCEIVYLLFCVFFVFREIKMFVKKGREHLKNPWSILEMVLTLLSLSAVGLYFARMTFTESALKSMEENGTGFVSFHYTAFLDEWLKCIMGVIVFLSFLKMFRLLRFNRRMSMLQQVLKRCFGHLLSFMVMFAFAFLAYALLASLVFGQSMEGFGTFWRSCASLMDTLLGKFTLKAMVKANRIIGPIFFYSYTVSMVFILINMFISIINDAFTEVRSDVEKQSNDYEIVDFMVHRLKENIGKTMGHAIHPIYKEPKSELEVNFDKIADNADNAMHFMRNIAFEDMRKTRWFQTDNCPEKKKNLMRLLMEVDWDFYEAELCDSIPVFERFLSQRSEAELEDILQYYRQKRMVEDFVFNQVHGEEDSTEESGSDSDDSDGSGSEDEKSSHDESDSESEPLPEDDSRLLTPAFGNTSRPVSVVKVKSPAVLVTDVEAETAEIQSYAEDSSRKGSFVEEAAAEVELLKILDDVRREQESRCVTDAELDSILYFDALSDDVKPSRCNSDPETITGKKNGGKKKRKKKQEAVKVAEAPKENTTKEAWITMEDKYPGDGEPEDVFEEKKKKKGTKEAKREKSDLEQGNDEADENDGKPKRKNKKKVVSGGQPEMDPTQNKNSDLEATGNEEEGREGKEKLKAKRKKHKSENKKVNGENESIEDEETTIKGSRSFIVGGTSGEMAEEEIHEEVGQKKKSKKKRNNETAVSPTTVDNGEERPNEIEETKKKAAGENMTCEEKTDENEETPKKKKKKKKAAGDDMAGEEKTDENEETPKKKKKKKAAGDDMAGEEKTDENEETPKKKKKKKAAEDDMAGEEKTDENEEKPKKKKQAAGESIAGEEKTNENEETPKKKKKKKGAAGENIAVEEKTDENEETPKKKKTKEKLKDEIDDILQEETPTLTDADQAETRKKKKGKTKKQLALVHDDGQSSVQSDEMAEETDKKKNEEVITPKEESEC